MDSGANSVIQHQVNSLQMWVSSGAPGIHGKEVRGTPHPIAERHTRSAFDHTVRSIMVMPRHTANTHTQESRKEEQERVQGIYIHKQTRRSKLGSHRENMRVTFVTEGYLTMNITYKNHSKGLICHLRKHAKNNLNQFRPEKRNSACLHRRRWTSKYLTTVPSVKNWRQKYHQEIQRQPHTTEQDWQRQEAKDLKDSGKKSSERCIYRLKNNCRDTCEFAKSGILVSKKTMTGI